jgi:hypothetical protein
LTTKTAARRDADAALDNLTLARKEGWQRFVNTAARITPEPLTRSQLERLGEAAFEEYNRQRREWHANLGPIKTPQLAELQEDLWDIVDSNVQDGDKAKGAVALDGPAGLGKTTLVLDFAKKFHRREIAEQGPETEAGHERWPVCRVGLTGNTGMVDFNRALLAFFAHPGNGKGKAAEFAHRALDCVLSCQTKLLIVDDLHFLQWRNTAGVAISNHFKYIANEFPVTMIFIGVGLAARGIFSEGASYEDAVIAQTGRRTTKLDIRAFDIESDEGRREWRQLLLALEQRAYRIADDVDQPRLPTRRPHRYRSPDSRIAEPDQDRRSLRTGPRREGAGVRVGPADHQHPHSRLTIRARPPDPRPADQR